MTKTTATDQLGQPVQVGDRIIIANCDIDLVPTLILGHVLRIREGHAGDIVLETLEPSDAYSDRARGGRLGTASARSVIIAPTVGNGLLEQFLPGGTTFSARYEVGGSYDFVVLGDGRIVDHDGDTTEMHYLDRSSIRDIRLPRGA